MTHLIGSFLLYSALMVLALVVVVIWRITHTLRCHFCRSTERIVRDLEWTPLCLDCFVEQLAPTPAILNAYDPEAQIPTVVMTSRRGGRS
jgi:hypothetical protein